MNHTVANNIHFALVVTKSTSFVHANRLKKGLPMKHDGENYGFISNNEDKCGFACK